MSSSPDSEETGSIPSTNEAKPGEIPQTPDPLLSTSPRRLIISQTSVRVPVVIPAEKKLAPTKPVKLRVYSHLNKRVGWYSVSIVGILTILLGFIFAVPLSTGQQKSTTIAQGISNLITNGQFGNVASQSQSQSAPGAGGSPGPRFFSSSSPWNVPIGTNVQLDPNSSGMVSQLVDCCHVPAMFSYGMPIYTSTASDPVYTVQDDDDAFRANQPIHIPDTAAPSPGSDKWLFIYDKTKNLLFEMWQAQKNGNTWSANTGDVFSPTGDGVHQVDGSTQSGNGASYFGGVITDVDIEQGAITHALSLATQFTASTWRYPMAASDGGGGNANALPMGARLQLDPSVNCNALPGASSGEKMVCKALETYGGYIRDTGGVTLSMYFEGEDLKDPARNPPDGSPGDPGRSNGVFGKAGLHDGTDLAEIPWNKLRVLKSWNSFTALNTTPLPAQPLFETFLGIASPQIAPLALGDNALKPENCTLAIGSGSVKSDRSSHQ